MIKEAITNLVSGESLTTEQSASVMEEIMGGEVTPAQFGAFVTALRLKGETVDEIVGLARTMRAHAIPLLSDDETVDTCGTGGDGSHTFNISTAAALVAAGAGLKVAKHGNRAASSQCGSADVLEALGVKIDLGAQQVKRCLEEVGMGFMFATTFHPAMKHAATPRREIGIRTVFNILGPLTNPAGARAQVLGVAEESLLEKMTEALKRLGSRHVLVVHGEDGLDEITITGKTQVCELKDGNIMRYSISPEDLGLSRKEPVSLKGGTAGENATLVRRVLGNDSGAALDTVLMNAAAALVAGDRVATLPEGIDLAREVIASGQARDKLDQLIEFSQRLSEETRHDS